MKKINLLLSVAIIMSATSCSEDSVMETGNETNIATDSDTKSVPITISSSKGNSEVTRASYTVTENGISATWDDNDKLLVLYDGVISTLSLKEKTDDGKSATFKGQLEYNTSKPTSGVTLRCYAKDSKQADNYFTINTSDGSITYNTSVLTAQNGSLLEAAKCNIYNGSCNYSSNIQCNLEANCCIMKFSFEVPGGAPNAKLTYKDGSSTVAATSTITIAQSEWGKSKTLCMAIPAKIYNSGAQTLTLLSTGSNNTSASQTKTLSETKATFAAGKIYSKTVAFDGVLATDGTKISGYYDFTPSGTTDPDANGDNAPHDYVVLTTESGALKWATMNIGATTVYDDMNGNSESNRTSTCFGKYYEWGATAPYPSSQSPAIQFNENTTWSQTKPWGYRKVTTAGATLPINYDTAHLLWGSSWKIPTRTHWLNLKNNNEWLWVTCLGGKTISGYIVTNKSASSSGKSLFLPASGRYYYYNGRLIRSGTYGYYWSSTTLSSETTYSFDFYSGAYNILGGNNPSSGETIRPVS